MINVENINNQNSKTAIDDLICALKNLWENIKDINKDNAKSFFKILDLFFSGERKDKVALVGEIYAYCKRQLPRSCTKIISLKALIPRSKEKIILK